MVDFALPGVYTHPDGWGPPPDSVDAEGLPEDVFNLAYDHLDKYPLPRIGRICDFTISGQKYQQDRLQKGKAKGKGKGVQVLAPGKDEEGFALVDNRPLPGKTFSRGRGFGFGRGKGRGKSIAANYQEGILGQKQKNSFFSNNQNQAKGKGKGRGGGQQRRGMPTFKEWSVQTKTEWVIKREISQNEIPKLQVDAKEVKCEDVVWCGRLQQYNKEFDRVTVRTDRPMKRFEDLNFFNVTASEDPVLQEMADDPEVTVIATDHVLACLIAAGRSVYSWDIIITKVQNKLLFDKRENSQVDLLSVNETAADPPNNDDKEHMNSPMKLAQEATCINQNFSQLVLDQRAQAEQMERPNPFEEESEGWAASGAYRYRKITIPGDRKDASEFNQNPVTIAVRTEVNCKMPSQPGEAEQYCSVKALNEFDPKIGHNWRKLLETQRGAIMATELKNNAFKIGRWVAQAVLAGADVMKIGYASRNQPQDPWNHTVLSVQTYITEKIAEQIGIHRHNVYGVLRNIINLVMSWDDGKYLFIKDPMKQMLRIYEVPWETFGEEDEGEEDEEEEEEAEELDEDGNVKPPQAVGPIG